MIPKTFSIRVIYSDDIHTLLLGNLSSRAADAGNGTKSE